MIAALLLLTALGDTSATRLVDDFEHPDRWEARQADGVVLRLRGDAGHRGRALRMDFEFQGGGYAIARRALPIDLPPNYAITFWLKGDAAPNTLEFKLVDESGENVWWYTERDRAFDGDWHKVTVRKRQVSFAWGPLGGGELTRADALELVITAGSGGGKGTVWFDELELTTLPLPGPYDLTPVATAWSSRTGTPPGLALDGDTLTAWWSREVRGADVTRTRTFTLDFGRSREFGGLTLLWRAGGSSNSYDVQLSDDGRRWRTVRQVRGSNGGRDDLLLPDSDARWLRLLFLDAVPARQFVLREFMVRPLEFGASRNAFFEQLAREAAPGGFPRYWSGRRAYWTVVGLDSAVEEALFNEDGAAEAGKGAFSLEPFLRDRGRTYTWHDVGVTPSLAEAALPIPSTTWRTEGLSLTITAFAIGPASQSTLVLRYRVRNESRLPRTPTLFLAVRPFQVNPPSQFLNTTGGTTRIDSLRWTGTLLRVNADRQVIPLMPPGSVGTATFDAGEIVSHILRGTLPARRAARDPMGAASAAFAWPLSLAAGDSAEVAVEVPLTPRGRQALPANDPAIVTQALEETVGWWQEALDRTRISLPASGDHLARTIRSTIGWILVNRDGPSIQPGSRSYERSWIRDGSLTSAALLRFGHHEEVRAFIEWYATFQYPNGKVPCCVDARGADPVPEHDSHGQLIYLIAEYWRHTGDTALVARMWPHIAGAVGYIEALRQTRRTAEFREGDQQDFFGLLPPSISHEGYSAKPMHSYWDDIFALRGLADAALLARVMGRADESARYAAMRAEFEGDVLASLERVMRRHRIDYLPGSADLGDFDATSTTVAVTPGNLAGVLPPEALRATFDRYWTNTTARLDSSTVWDAYTPYELRTVGTVLRLGSKDRALALMRMFLADQEPMAWNQWPEVVWHDRRVLKFIGDSPHTWVGSDFLRSAADLFAYEVEADSALIVGAGIDPAWLEDAGVRVERLGTWWGPLSYTARRDGNVVRYRIEGGIRMPPGGLRLAQPRSEPAGTVTVDGNSATPDADSRIVVRELPADIVFAY